MAFTVGGTDVSKVFLGSTPVAAVYLGAEKVWPLVVDPNAPPWRFTRIADNTDPPGDAQYSMAYTAHRWQLMGFRDLDGKDVSDWMSRHATEVPTLRMRLSEDGGAEVSVSHISDVQITGNGGNGQREGIQIGFNPTGPAIGHVVVVEFVP